MNIRPIDLQVLIPRATEISKAQSITDRQSSLQQQQFAEQFQKISANLEHQVQSTPKSSGAKIKRENEHEQQQKREKQEQKKNFTNQQQDTNEKTTIQQPDPLRGHIIDIKT